jgi:kynurenine formamidase
VDVAEVRLEEYGGGRTHAYRPELPAPGRDGLGPVTRLVESMANGSINNLSELRMVVHAGTHVDAPGHMVQEHFEAGLDADKLDLDVLNGKLAMAERVLPTQDQFWFVKCISIYV